MLAQIDSENTTEKNTATLKKVAYVQLISDIYSEQIDLYWLSAQWLFDFNPETEDDTNYKKIFLDKCLKKLSDEMPNKGSNKS